MDSHHDYHIAAEADVDSRVNRQIWFYFIALGILLFLTILGLTIMYRFQVDYEKTEKIGNVNTVESMNQMNESQSILTGKKGLFDGKRHVAIDVAMHQFVISARKGD